MLSTTHAVAVCALIACAGIGGAISGGAVGEPSHFPTSRIGSTPPWPAFPLANGKAKGDRLDSTVTTAEEPAATFSIASAGPVGDIEPPARIAAPPAENVSRPTTLETKPVPTSKPKAVAAKAAAPRTVLTELQLATFRQRLNLSSSQEGYWPGVEQALRAVIRELDEAKRRNPAIANSEALDGGGANVQRLKMAAFPLLLGMREDQKQEVRALARTIGLPQVAAQI